MVFQLITFFMLVVSFKVAEVDKSLVLPVVGSAGPTEPEDYSQFLILNLRSGGKLFVQGKEQPNFEDYIAIEARSLRARASQGGGEVTVVIRADRTLKFEFVKRVIDVCKNNGLAKFDFMVLRGGANRPP
jgi:biopolymer transport protein ExbD